MSVTRETFASRIGFIFMTAGCAIGLGNVWRFPYVAGQYGGGMFVLFYLIFLLIFGLPIMLMELSIGRAGQSTLPGAFRKLQNPSSRFKWQIPAYVFFSGNLILLMFYTVVTGWLLIYACHFCIGDHAVFADEFFPGMQQDYRKQIIYMIFCVIITALICMGGVRKMIEKSIKIIMAGLFLLIIILVAQALSLPGAADGIKFFLLPDTGILQQNDLTEILYAAMSQAFFTLSIGIGSITVCGSYVSRDRSLFQESFWIILLDTIVAVASGIIIFPSCLSYGVKPDSGPPLIFNTLPKVFHDMPMGILWGSLFFIFLFIAALSTLIAVFENLTAFGMDELKWNRKKSCIIFAIILAIFSLPCIFGFNLWENFHPLGEDSNILDLEDFIVSSNMLPFGSLYLVLFCSTKIGWGLPNFINEVQTGKGWKINFAPAWFFKFLLPLAIILLWLAGIIKFFT